MQTIRDLASLRTARAALNGTIALVPTMGALHAGHMALIDAAKAHADHVVVSIFVNPLQFGANEDLVHYPREEARDSEMLAAADVAVLWMPPVTTMYPDGFATHVVVDGLGDMLEGVSRPGHFEGVATVVVKLFNQVRPDIAVFGEKDWQQLAIVRRLTIDFDFAIAIVGMPILRDADGLALSSRNAYLTGDERRAARALPRALHAAARAIAGGAAQRAVLDQARDELRAGGLTVDYVECWDHRVLAAARIGTTRLIDNVPIT